MLAVMAQTYARPTRPWHEWVSICKGMEAAMAKAYSGGMNFEFNSGGSARTGPSRARPQRPEPETPFRMLVLGDFSSRESRGISQAGAQLAARRPISIDTD